MDVSKVLLYVLSRSAILQLLKGSNAFLIVNINNYNILLRQSEYGTSFFGLMMEVDNTMKNWQTVHLSFKNPPEH